ncbi:zinc finger MYM-type 1-like [Paramuricea clavata]|uniref:Zinc finger MYM-type 1-like n=1 Tax=Paramuricea clavata TaxID=317549 RepID=A0A7D9DPI6_PARCT|nr:zinc finger MYM-type 1-like [Paramuricea clavata]
MIDSAAEIERNRDAIKIMLDITRTLARQGLAMRGSSEENEGNSNFNQFVQLLSRHVPSFKRWLADAPKRPHAARYLSPKSQNEYIKLLGEDVSNRVTEEINRSAMWSVIADTTPNVSHTDQMAVVARYVCPDSGLPTERLVDIKDINDKTGDGQALAIIASLDRKCLDKNGIAFQSYDFTASMSGVFRGCQAKMQTHLERDIPYIPCTAHRINTSVEHSCEASVPVCALFELLQELFVFVTSSTKRFDVYREKVKQSDEELLMLRNLSATRWVAREESICAVWSSYTVVLEVLEVLTDSKYDTKTRVKAGALQDKMKSFNFLVMLMFMKNVMGKTKCLTTEVQGIEMNIIDTIESFKTTITTLEHIRNDGEGLKNQIQATKSVAEQHGIDPDDEYNRHHRQRKKPRRIDDHPETAANLCLVEHYRKEFFAVLDAQINAIKANLEAVTNILQPAVTLLQPPYIGPVDNTELLRIETQNKLMN